MKAVYIFIIYVLTLMPVLAQDTTAIDALLTKAGAALYNNPEDAIILGRQAYKQAGTIHEKKVAALITISNGYFALKKTGDAQKYAFRALALARTANDYTNQVKVYGLLGNHYQVLKLNAKAREFLGNAERVMQEHPLPEALRYLKGNVFAIKGNSYKSDLDCDYAISYFDRAIYEFQHTTHRSATANLKLVQVQKGFCLLDLNRPREAAVLFNSIIKTTSAGQMFDTWVYACIGLARSHNLEKDYTGALGLLNNALANTPAGAREEVKCELYRNLSENYYMAGDNVKYKYYNTLFHTSQAGVLTLTGQNFNTVINEMATRQATRLEATTTVHKKQLILLYAFAAACLCATAIVIYRKKVQVKRLQQALFRKSLQ